MKKITFIVLSVIISASVLFVACTKEKTPPVADFKGSKTTIYAGETISFTDLSTNSPTSWSWTFEGGTPSTSTTQNPAGIRYSTPGTYKVTLSADNADGNGATTKNAYIKVNSASGTKLTFWTDKSDVGVITVATQGTTDGTVTLYYTSNPGCDATGCVTVNFVTLGNVSYKCTEATNTWIWEGNFTLAYGCNTMQLTHAKDGSGKAIAIPSNYLPYAVYMATKN